MASCYWLTWDQIQLRTVDEQTSLLQLGTPETASDVPGTNQQQLGGIAGAAAIQLQGRLSDIAPVSDKYMRGVESYKYLRFAVHATTKFIFGTDALVATAKKALITKRR
ncbi:MAG: hypothetical protein FRX49_11465 [Trebouxia sp. A1-2]|nr:MAG: hypothetical protein FRX49_13611 [Trebouxia sp. A1-2]KAA6418519.1 MAG: hypothetical protein FRX49_11465 [Trebouxia sp. A1-2]